MMDCGVVDPFLCVLDCPTSDFKNHECDAISRANLVAIDMITQSSMKGFCVDPLTQPRQREPSQVSVSTGKHPCIQSHF